MGVLAAPLSAAAPNRWARQTALVRLFGGGLSSAPRRAVLDGANLAAVRLASGEWELIQFEDAELTEPGLWRLRGILRGQAGTAIAHPAPVGAPFVMLDGAVSKLDATLAPPGLSRRFLVGPAHLPPHHETYRAWNASFDCLGLAPLAPAWITARRGDDGLSLAWAARRREDADGWGERSWDGAPDAAFRVAVSTVGGERLTRTVRGETLRIPRPDLEAAGATGRLWIAVAEICGAQGRGAEARIMIDG